MHIYYSISCIWTHFDKPQSFKLNDSLYFSHRCQQEKKQVSVRLWSSCYNNKQGINSNTKSQQQPRLTGLRACCGPGPRRVPSGHADTLQSWRRWLCMGKGQSLPVCKSRFCHLLAAHLARVTCNQDGHRNHLLAGPSRGFGAVIQVQWGNTLRARERWVLFVLWN